MRAVLIAWGIESLAAGGTNVSAVFLAKNTFSAGDFGYGLIYGSIGAGLVIGSFTSAPLLERHGVATVYGASLALMALGFVAAGASPDIWVAAACCVVLGCGNGAAVACNALLVQRGTFDVMRGRALTLVMSLTFSLVGVGEVAGGLFVRSPGPRWLWIGAGGTVLIASVAGWAIARRLGGETAAEAELAPAAVATAN